MTLGDQVHQDTVRRYSNVVFTRIPMLVQPPWLRFGFSLLSTYPAVISQYRSKEVEGAIRAVLSRFRRDAPDGSVIVEHVPAAYYIRAFEAELGGVRIALRSHDVLGEAFRMLAVRCSGLMRRLWTYEAKRVASFERYALRAATTAWAITSEDAREYERLYSLGFCPQVMGVGIDVLRFSAVSDGSPNSAIHIGGSDARKGDGLHWLVDTVWPIVKKLRPSADLILAGKGSHRFARPEHGIRAFGPVSDDAAFMSKGAVFVNPQKAGSGLKIKSINALAAGKALVTTANGCRGLGGRNGVEYLCCDDAADFASSIVACMTNIKVARSMRRAGRELAVQKFSWERVRPESERLVSEFLYK